jgi:SAM-dependent methyltransferase
VAVVITICDDAPHLEEALRSCRNQTVRPSEVLLVARGGDQRRVRDIAASYAAAVVQVPEGEDRALARPAILASVSANFVVFLNADERLTREAIEASLHCFADNSEAWLVCGAHRLIDEAGRPASPVWREHIDPEKSLVGGTISLEAAVMYRVDRVRGGICVTGDSTSPLIASHDVCVAESRCGKGRVPQRLAMRRYRQEDSVRQPGTNGHSARELLFHYNAPQAFAAAARELARNGGNWNNVRTMLHALKMAPVGLLKIALSRGATVFSQRLPRWIGRLFGEALWRPRPGGVRFGDFGRTTPISSVDGFDRGKPIDRYYIEHALAEYSELVRGRVLEVHNSRYTQMFGGEKVVRSDILDINPLNQAATIVGDLGAASSLPEEAFDCIIITQTLQFIYQLDTAMENLYRALAPDGCLLITVPGISPIGRGQTQSWYWEFTELSLRTMLAGKFDEGNVRTQSHGNVFAAICFLTGLSLAEVDAEKLRYDDERYPVIVAACAHKMPKAV